MIGDKEVVALDVSDDLKTYTMEKTGKRIYSRPPSMFSKTTGLAAVEFPHPGTSYNPTFQDHQDLLRQACEVEKKEIIQEKTTKRRLGPMLKKIPVEQREVSVLLPLCISRVIHLLIYSICFGKTRKTG